uniref:Uncharacterized protein n=1 Tax=Panagrolaimus sp. ES5 TaxID=591445 RepID=A0AC34FG84_9BILA
MYEIHRIAAVTKLSDYTHSIDLQAKKDSYSWNKSNKHLASDPLNLNQESEAQHEFKKSKSSSKNSTLSLHIAAYENSVDYDTADSNDGKTEDSKSKNQKANSMKKWEASKQVFTGLISFNENSFEFTRQQEDQSNHSEVMQFKASQRLRNPNEEN